jgi:hypothetical protein
MFKDRERQLKAQRDHYHNNKGKYAKQHRDYKRRSIDFVIEYKKSDDVKCEVCGEERWPCLDFHHIYPQHKAKRGDGTTTTISRMARSGCSIARLKEEIAKCRVLCANCHRIEHCEEF